MIGLILIILFLLGLYFLLSIQNRPVSKPVRRLYKHPKSMGGFVPIEASVVPNAASHTNKMNDKLGNVRSSQGYGPGILEVVIPSDYYQFSSRPGEYYWPSGSIFPDYIYNGSHHKKITVN
jgi:hypothetical protein